METKKSITSLLFIFAMMLVGSYMNGATLTKSHRPVCHEAVEALASRDARFNKILDYAWGITFEDAACCAGTKLFGSDADYENCLREEFGKFAMNLKHFYDGGFSGHKALVSFKGLRVRRNIPPLLNDLIIEDAKYILSTQNKMAIEGDVIIAQSGNGVFENSRINYGGYIMPAEVEFTWQDSQDGVTDCYVYEWELTDHVQVPGTGGMYMLKESNGVLSYSPIGWIFRVNMGSYSRNYDGTGIVFTGSAKMAPGGGLLCETEESRIELATGIAGELGTFDLETEKSYTLCKLLASDRRKSDIEIIIDKSFLVGRIKGSLIANSTELSGTGTLQLGTDDLNVSISGTIKYLSVSNRLIARGSLQGHQLLPGITLTGTAQVELAFRDRQAGLEIGGNFRMETANLQKLYRDWRREHPRAAFSSFSPDLPFSGDVKLAMLRTLPNAEELLKTGDDIVNVNKTLIVKAGIGESFWPTVDFDIIDETTHGVSNYGEVRND